MAEDIRIPNLPSAGQLKAWKYTVFQNVNIAAQRDDDKALEWVSRVGDPNVTDEELGEPPERRFRQ